jgi:hypothetical protein
MLITYYRIVGGDERYIGSTIRTIKERFGEHIRKQNCSVKHLFGKYGIQNCQIEEIETRECATKKERLKYEGQLIRDTPNCINDILSGRTAEEYYAEYHDEIREKQKEYYGANREVILRQKREKHSLIPREERDRRNAMARERRRIARLTPTDL